MIIQKTDRHKMEILFSDFKKKNRLLKITGINQNNYINERAGKRNYLLCSNYINNRNC